jgi:O-antigen/teichoic acid export membrane protein
MRDTQGDERADSPPTGRPPRAWSPRAWDEWERQTGERSQWADPDEDQSSLHTAGWEQGYGFNGELPSLQLDTMATLPIPAVRPRERQRGGGTSEPAMEAVGIRTPPSPPDGVPIEEMPTWILPAVGIKSVSDRTTMRLSAVVAGAASYMTMLRSLVKTSAIYAVAALGTPLIALLLAPFLTHKLSVRDFGVLTILNTAIGLGAGLTQLGLGSAFFRAYSYDFVSKRDRRDVLSTVVLLLCLSSIALLFVAWLTSAELSALFLGRSDLGEYVLLAAIAILVQNLTVPGYAFLRAENRAAVYSTLAITSAMMSLVATVVFVGVLRMGVAGALLATGVAYGSVVVGMIPFVFARTRLHIRMDIARNVLAFGIPLVPSVASSWVLQLSDRYLLAIFGSLSQTATYAVAYTLGSLISVAILTPFNLAWPTSMFQIAKRKDGPQVFQLVFRWLSILLLFAAFGLSVAATFVLNLLFPVSYHASAEVIPVIALSLVFYGLYPVLMIGVNIKRKTWISSALITVAAAVNFGLNIILIPRFGAAGAAATTLVAYMVLSILAYFANQRLYAVPYEVGRFAAAALGGVLLYLACFDVATMLGFKWFVLLGIVALLVYAVWLGVVGDVGEALRMRRRLSGRLARSRA